VGGHLRALAHRGRVGRQDVHEAAFPRIGDDGLVHEATFWLRPLPALNAPAAALAPGSPVAGAWGRMRAALLLRRFVIDGQRASRAKHPRAWRQQIKTPTARLGMLCFAKVKAICPQGAGRLAL